MATIAEPIPVSQPQRDMLVGTPRAHAIDRWIFVFMALWFIAIVLTGFIPDSLEKIAAVKAGKWPPFPLVLHFHAVLMGSFLLVLFAQTWLMATGRGALHMQLGVLGMVLAVALIVVGFILAPTNYHLVWNAAQSGSPVLREAMVAWLPQLENILLLQLRIGILFILFLAIALSARGRNPGLHKRMIILATAIPLAAGIDRIQWLPTTVPQSMILPDLYVLAAVSPMLAWDVFRNQAVHRAYWIWTPIYVAASVAVNMAWDTPWWHSMAPQIMGV